ncbi:MAG: oxaloacetate decarboxylase [Alphaproteobacteria bacterium]|nr:oxaloacetate decarboxylase [Alphaproteobacteria bacterium]MDP6589921.1 oxaloacetate decarboxylase [Alphaproteobacteria bacterium]MDP6816879.1 oxaloacetate decarboxylase [Alphaproteobacteria bacterium]
MSNVTKKLRALIAGDGLVPIVGAYDALSARLVERAGFEIMHVGGYNLSASHLGLPDVGYLTLSETVDLAGRIAANTALPVIADGDDGYGNHLNTGRLIFELERAGLAGVHIEDQLFPKRCGHMAGKRLVAAAAFEQKIKAAVDARRDGDFTIIARTDAIAVEGFEKAIERANLYAEAGADVVFVEAPESEDQAARVPNAVTRPALYNWCYGGKSPLLSAEHIAAMGYKFVLFTDALYAVSKTLIELYDEIKRTGTYLGYGERMLPFDEFNQLLDLDRVAALDEKYGG